MIWYKVGAADETPGKSGLAHFLEHLMFKGTAKNPAGQFSQVVARIGGQENAFTSNDYTGYYQRVPSEQLKTVMEFEADRMTGLRAHRCGGAARAQGHPGGAEPARRQQSARAARRADRRRALSQPSLRQAGDRLAPRDGAAHPRRRHRLLSALLRAQQRGGGGRRRRRARGGARAGRGDLRQGQAPTATIAPRQRPQEPPPVAVRYVTLADPRVEQPSVQRAYLVPSFATAKPRRVGSAGGAGAYPGRRLQQPALPRPGGRQASSRSAPAPGTTVRRSTWPKFGVYGAPQPGRDAAAARSRRSTR